MEQKQFDKAIVQIKTNGAKLDAMLHECAMFALEQINAHGNNGPVNKLLGAINKSTRKEALYTWFNDFGLCKKNKDNTLSYSKDKKLKDKEGVIITANDAMLLADETPFYNYTKEITPASSYDVDKAIASILKRAASFAKEGKVVQHQEKLDALKELLPATK